MEPTRKKSLRLRIFIYPRFQFTLLAVNVITLLIGYAFVFGQLKRSFANLRKLGIDSGLAEGHTYFQFLQFQEDGLYSVLWVGLLLALAISCVFVLLISHRLAGPLARLRSYFRQIGEMNEGAPTPELHFRAGDYFMDLPPVINFALKRLRQGG